MWTKMICWFKRHKWSTNNLQVAAYCLRCDKKRESTVPIGIFFSPDGLQMFVVGDTYDTVYSFTLSTPWDVSTAVQDSLFKSVAAEDTP